MTKKEKRLDRLKKLLFDLPVDNLPMTASELDGYVTGVLACPEPIPLSDWLPEVWGKTGQPQFGDNKKAEETIGAVIEHFNCVAEAMPRSLWIEPIFEVEANSAKVRWEPWVDGFMRAILLRPDVWENFRKRANADTRTTLIFLRVLQDIYTGRCKLTAGEIADIDIEAPDLIPGCVATILGQSRPDFTETVAANLPYEPQKTAHEPGRNEAPVEKGSVTRFPEGRR